MPGSSEKRCGAPHTFFFASARLSRLRAAALLPFACLALATGCLGGRGLPPPLSSEPTTAEGEDQARALYERGVTEAADRRYESAFAAFDSVVEGFPGSRWSGISLRERGLASYRLGRDGGAAADLQRFLERASGFETTDTAIVLASALERTGNAEGAFAALVRYLPESDDRAPGARAVAEAAARVLPAGAAPRLARDLPRRGFLEPLYRRAADELGDTDPARAEQLQRLAQRIAGPGPGRGRVIVEEPGRGGTAAVVGAILPEAGRFAAVGREIADGVRLALEELAREEQGPALALEVVPEEEAGTGAAVERLAEHDVHVVIGPLASDAAVAAAAAARDRAMLLITPTATDSTLLRMGGGVVALNATRGDLGEALGEFAALRLGLLRVAVIGSDDDYGRANARTFRRAFEERGGVVVLEHYATAGEANFGAPLRMAGHEGATALFLPLRSGDQVLTILSQMEYYSGGTFRLLGTEVWRDGSFLGRAGAFAEGAYFADTFSPDTRVTRYVEFRRVYEERYGRPPPSNFPAWGYDAAVLALRYLTGKGAGADALYVGAAATYRIRDGRVARMPVVSRVEAGSPALVWTPEQGASDVTPEQGAPEVTPRRGPSDVTPRQGGPGATPPPQQAPSSGTGRGPEGAVQAPAAPEG
jgi:branched-chain amino acid transport system substrate-binding protein